MSPQPHPSESQVHQDLKARYGEANYTSKVTNGTHKIIDAGGHYRSGMMKSKSLSGLLHLIDKKVNNKSPTKGSLKVEELDATIHSSDKIKVARVIADMLGVEDADRMSPETAINTGLRKIKNKKLGTELTKVLRKMVALAQEVGVKVDTSLIPVGVAEQTYTSFKSNLKPKNNEEDQSDKIASDADETDTPDNTQSQIGHTISSPSDDQLRRRKVAYHTEDVQSADYKINPQTGYKYRARHIYFKNSGSNASLDDDEKEQDDDQKTVVYHKPLLKKIKEETKSSGDERLDDMTDEHLDDMADDIDEPEDIADLYEPDEIALIDKETGEVVEDEDEDDLQEQTLNEVMSRMQRLHARIRFMQTKSKRARRLQVALKSRSSTDKINKRARNLAIKMLKQKLMKKPVSQMSVVEKEQVEKLLSKRKSLVDRLAMKLIPRIRKIENDRLSHAKFTK